MEDDDKNVRPAALRILKEKFGYDAFKSDLQRDAVEAVLRGKSWILVSIPVIQL